MRKFRKLIVWTSEKIKPLEAILLIFLIGLLCYGIQLKNLGFYLDDWYILWAGQAGGSELIARLHQIDRPLMGHIFAFNYSWLGDSALNWHIFTFLIRIGSALLVYGIMRMVWPDKRMESTSVALLTLVYPGFLEQPNAMTYSNHLGTLFIALLSVAFSIKGVQEKSSFTKIIYHSLGVVFASIYLFFVEFMIGIEGIRICLIWLASHKKTSKPTSLNLRSAVFNYLPYSVPIFIMLYWRIFLFESGRAAMNIDRISALYLNPSLSNYIRLFLTTITDFFETVLFAWFSNAFIFVSTAENSAIVTSIIVGVIGMALYIIVVYRTRPIQDQVIDAQNHLMWFGLFGTIFAIIPIVIVGREIHLDQGFNGFNRYTLPAIFGCALLVVGVIQATVKEKFRVIVIAGLIGLSLISHYHNGLLYRTAWEQEKELWWQATWRMPDIKADTVLVVAMPPESRFLEGYEIWAPANIIYRPNSEEVSVTGQILNSETRDWFLRGKADQPMFRGAISFERDYGDALLITYPNELSCIHVIDQNLIIDNGEESNVLYTAHVSTNERILLSGERHLQPPSTIFGPEPKRGWCYYFQKIELAQQYGDWELAAQLGDEALRLDLKPLNRAEWLPVISAYLNTGRMEEARQLAKIVRDDRELKNFICKQIGEVDVGDNNGLNQLSNMLCG